MNTVENTETQISSGVTTFANHIHQQLVNLVGDIVETHQDDLLVHDANAIERSTTRAFIHVSYCSGTHYYEIPQVIDDDSRVDYLFGRKRPSSIYRDILGLLAEYFGREWYFGFAHTYCYSDGKTVKIVSKDEAVAIYRRALLDVLRDLRYSARPSAALA